MCVYIHTAAASNSRVASAEGPLDDGQHDREAAASRQQVQHRVSVKALGAEIAERVAERHRVAEL